MATANKVLAIRAPRESNSSSALTSCPPHNCSNTALTKSPLTNYSKWALTISLSTSSSNWTGTSASLIPRIVLIITRDPISTLIATILTNCAAISGNCATNLSGGVGASKASKTCIMLQANRHHSSFLLE